MSLNMAVEIFVYIDRYTASANSELFDLKITYTSLGYYHHQGTTHPA